VNENFLTMIALISMTLGTQFISMSFSNESLPNGTHANTTDCINPLTKDYFFSSMFNQTCATCRDIILIEQDKIVHSCGNKFKEPKFAPLVHLMNASMFTSQDASKNQSGGGNTEDWCMMVNFYAPYCPFSARLAPFYNALPRAFPSLFIAAVDATQNSKINLVYGISGTPTLLLFHNGRPVARFESGTYGVNNLIEFVTKHTDLDPVADVDVQDEDLLGPLPAAPADNVDFYLVLAWCFIIISSLYYFCKSSLGQRLFETLKRNWREMDEE
jgi:thiol-disulfide isomerase/thioredoxin